jgi:hypothetical protein
MFLRKNTLSSGKITIVILPEKSTLIFHPRTNFPLVRRCTGMLLSSKTTILDGRVSFFAKKYVFFK